MNSKLVIVAIGILLLGIVLGILINSTFTLVVRTKVITTTITKTTLIPKTYTKTVTHTEEEVLTTTYTRTLTRTKYEVRTLTKFRTLVKELTLTRTTTKVFTVTTTTISTTITSVTRKLLKTLTITKTITQTRTYTLTSWPIPPRCLLINREVLNDDIIICALSEWVLLKPIARMFSNYSDIRTLAVSIASWISKNIKYVTDKELFGREFIQYPLETLGRGLGDCEDLSLLEAAIMLATGRFKYVVIAEVTYENLRVGHVEAGYYYEGKAYLVPWTKSPYPMTLNDYYGWGMVHDAKIDSIKLYVVGLINNSLSIIKKYIVSKDLLRYAYPPPIGTKELSAIKEVVNDFIEDLGYKVKDYPKYLDEIALFISGYEPLKEPPLKPVSYYRIEVPIDWFTPKNISWIKWRFKLLLSRFKSKLSSWLSSLSNKTTPLYTYVEVDNDYILVSSYRPDGTIVKVKKLLPTIVIYVLRPRDYPVPRVEVSTNDKLVISIFGNVSKVDVVIYNEELRAVLCITKPSVVYENIRCIEGSWSKTSWGTKIEVSINKVLNNLPGKGLYELIVWTDGKVSYIKIIRVK